MLVSVWIQLLQRMKDVSGTCTLILKKNISLFQGEFFYFILLKKSFSSYQHGYGCTVMDTIGGDYFGDNLTNSFALIKITVKPV